MKSTMWSGRVLDFALTVASIFTIVLATYYGADWWHLNGTPAWPRGRLLLLRVCGALLLALATTSLAAWLLRCGPRGRWLFAGWAAAAALLYAAIWPGYLMSDSVSALKYGLEFPFDLWLGLFTPFFNSAVLQLVPHVGALSACQLLLAAAVLAYASDTIVQITGRKAYALLFAAFVVLSPALVYNFGLLARDTLFSLVVLWLAVFVVRLANRIAVGSGVLLLAGLFTGLAGVIRGADGWFVLLPMLAIVPWIVRDWRLAGKFAGAVALTLALFAVVLPASLGRQGDAFAYTVANTVNPLGYILQNKFSTDHGRNLDAISKVVSVDKLRTEQTPYEIPAWWSGGLIRPDAGPEHQAAYMPHVVAYLRENVAVFLAGRVHTFAAATGLSEKGFKMDDLYRANWPTQWIPPERYNVDLSAGRPFPALSDGLKSWLDGSARFDPSLVSGSAIFWNVLPWIALLLAVIITQRHVAGLRFAALMVVARVPVVFLGAPASQFKYYLPVMLCGAFVLALALPAWLRRVAPVPVPVPEKVH